jgi:hypothetical protein
MAITGPVEADVDDVGAHSACGEQRPIEDQVGGPGQQRLVLIAGWLAFDTVGHDDRWPSACRHRAHFDRGRESGPSTAS